MEHSKNYDKVKRYYDLGIWNGVRVQSAVRGNQITEEKLKGIIDEDYA